jgi:hypothetical protein
MESIDSARGGENAESLSFTCGGQKKSKDRLIQLPKSAGCFVTVW